MTQECLDKIEWLTNFFLNIAQLLPRSPLEFRIQYLIEMINQESAWGLGGVVLEMLSGIIQYIQLIVAWKFVKLAIGIIGSRF